MSQNATVWLIDCMCLNSFWNELYQTTDCLQDKLIYITLFEYYCFFLCIQLHSSSHSSSDEEGGVGLTEIYVYIIIYKISNYGLKMYITLTPQHSQQNLNQTLTKIWFSIIELLYWIIVCYTVQVLLLLLPPLHPHPPAPCMQTWQYTDH